MNSKMPDQSNWWKRLLSRLPQYDPPEQIWSNIEASLDREETDFLPLYDPSDLIWDKIDQEINPSQKIHKLWSRSAFRLASVAVLTGLVGLTSLLMWQSRQREHVQYTYHEESTVSAQFAHLQEDDEEAFVLLDQWCTNYPFECAQPEIQELKGQLSELASAKAHLTREIGQYEANPILVRQLVDLEKERTRLMNALIAKI